MSSNDSTAPPLIVRDEVGSTNDELIALATRGAEDGTALVAHRQTAGRGRRGRTWHTLPGEHLLVSVLFRPTLDIAHLSGLTLDIGVAVAEVLEAHGLAPRLKWPNDILLSHKKVGGILCEVIDGPAVIVGLGLNVAATALPPDIAQSATTLQTEGAPLTADALLPELVAAVRAACRAYDRRGAPRIVAWRERTASLGARVRALSGPGPGRLGEITDIAPDGALLIRWDGASDAERFFAGELETLAPGAPS